jgi:ectoine hydroxylase-related dioxygenase (phytanoyl-CoA dioxygenase family)
MNPTLELEQETLKADFERDGFAVARGLFSPSEVDESRERFEVIHQNGAVGHDDGIRDEKDPLYQWPRIVHPHRFDAVARRYMLHPAVRSCLAAILGEEPVATQSMYYFKPPGARGQALHQDNMYLLVQPGTGVAAWTAIDRTDRENGCMMVVPKTQDCIMLCQEKADKTVTFSGAVTRIPKGLRAVEVPMNPGDTLFFNGSVIHGSGPNRSKDRFRRSFIGHYAAGSLEKISKFYLPLVRMDGTDIEVAVSAGGGPCGDSWEGALH